MRIHRAVRRTFVSLSVVALLLGSAAVGLRLYRAWLYPYGWSHCCDLGLEAELDRYARDHNGSFPAGEVTPEASLSLLYPTYADAKLLRGKSVPLDVVEGILERGERLGPETCGWHYVEGLTMKDDPKLALFWDKAGLDHNGGRLPAGGHMVSFVEGFGSRRYVSAKDWPAFIADQESLLAARNASRSVSKPVVSAE